MSLILSLALGAHAQGCEKISVADLTAAPGPGVLVLGERHGTRKDLNRARKIALKLLKHGPVTLAVEAVPADAQPTLDAFQGGKLLVDALPGKLSWHDEWGFSFDAYEKLLLTYQRGVELVALGQPIELRPDDQTVQLPPGYVQVLSDTMGDAPVPVELESRLVQTMAWHDSRLASRALDAWDGQGWLVVVVDRTWIEGGLGVQWQATRLTEAPVQAALLAHAGTQCYPGDRALP
jgi:hypothetical protein